MENKIRLGAAAILLFMTAFFPVMNWRCIITNLRNKSKGIDKHYSMAPSLSAVFAVCAYIVYPFSPKGWIFLIPALDAGNWLMLTGLLLAFTRGTFKGAFTFRKGPPRRP